MEWKKGNAMQRYKRELLSPASMRNNDMGESVVMRLRWVATKAVCEGVEGWKGRSGGSPGRGEMCCCADVEAFGLAQAEELTLKPASS